jgi:hypothetical protein
MLTGSGIWKNQSVGIEDVPVCSDVSGCIGAELLF